MKRVYIYSAVFIGLFCLVGWAFAQPQLPDPLNGATFGTVLGKIATAVAGIVGGVGTIMFIVAGILFLTSAGSPNQMAKAKTTLIYAIVGMVIGMSASAIIAWVGQVAK